MLLVLHDNFALPAPEGRVWVRSDSIKQEENQTLVLGDLALGLATRSLHLQHKRQLLLGTRQGESFQPWVASRCMNWFLLLCILSTEPVVLCEN